MDRFGFLRGPGTPSDIILELGAGYTPVAAKRDGWQTHVVDHASRDELCRKYAAAHVDTALIEDVDTIWERGPLHEAVPDSLRGRVGVLIASHVLEHLPDLVGFLRSAEILIAESGVLSVALPDKRYCFDCYRPWTTTGDLLDAHARGLTRHTLRTAFEHVAYAAWHAGRLGWGPYRVEPPQLLDQFQSAANVVAEYSDAPEQAYRDYHAWKFTPAGFELCLLELRALGLTGWWVDEITPTVGFEFLVHLRHSRNEPVLAGERLQARRQKLVLRQMLELKEQAEFLLTSDPIPSGRWFSRPAA